LTINGHNGSGVLINNIENYQIIDVKPERYLKLDITEASKVLVLGFKNKSARNESITGGKGSSLSILKDLSEHQSSSFIVPNGFVVTTNSYDLLLRENPELESAIHKLEQISW